MKRDLNSRQLLITLIIELETGKIINVTDFLKILGVMISIPTLHRLHQDLKVFYNYQMYGRKLFFNKSKSSKKINKT